MKRYLIIGIACIVAISGAAQTVSIARIKADADYLWGEGGPSFSRQDADRAALDDLISQISINVQSSFEQIDRNAVKGDNADTETISKSIVNTYSQATLENTERLSVNNADGSVTVFRYIKKSEIDRIFNARRRLITDWVEQGQQALRKREVANALRLYYWSYCLLRSIPKADEMTYSAGGKTYVLLSWLPEQINAVFSKMDIMPDGSKIENGVLNLCIMYDGKPVANFDYTYFDGQDWSSIFSAKDGRGAVQLNSDEMPDKLDLQCEYEFISQIHDKELESVTSMMNGYPFPKARMTVQCKNRRKPAALPLRFDTECRTDDIGTGARSETAAITPLSEQAAELYKEKIERIIAAVRNNRCDDASLQDCFTAGGWDMFQKLIAYGNVHLLNTIRYTFVQIDSSVVCRSVPMLFDYKNNMRRFVEDVTFTFDGNRKIESLAFGLDNEAFADIMKHEEWQLSSRYFLVTFLENYKTAFALKRRDYIKNIFADNAVIITGTVVKPCYDAESNKYANHPIVRYNRQTKEQYITGLERCFDRNEFINVRFGNNEVLRSSKGGELFSVQIKQDYYSTNYGDQGYLFLMVDLNNPHTPIIKVRTWQPQKDPDFGIYGLADFN